MRGELCDYKRYSNHMKPLATNTNAHIKPLTSVSHCATQLAQSTGTPIPCWRESLARRALPDVLARGALIKERGALFWVYAAVLGFRDSPFASMPGSISEGSGETPECMFTDLAIVTATI
jgi:hypothetical protein